MVNITHGDGRAGSLVYHLLQSIDVYVGALQGYPLCNFRRKSYCICFDLQIFLIGYGEITKEELMRR
jgi:hypothetical protein